MRPAKIQISLRIRAIWSESSQGEFRIAKDAKFLHADNEDSNQTARKRRPIWVIVGRTCHKVRFLTSRIVLITENYYIWFHVIFAVFVIIFVHYYITLIVELHACDQILIYTISQYLTLSKLSTNFSRRHCIVFLMVFFFVFCFFLFCFFRK